MIRSQSRFIYARPSLQEGIARLVDFGGALDIYTPATRQNPRGAAALTHAWLTIGHTLRQTIETEADSRHDS